MTQIFVSFVIRHLKFVINMNKSVVRRRKRENKRVEKYDWKRHTPAVKMTLFWLKNVLIITLLLGGIGVFFSWVLNPNTLPIKKISINGTIRTANENVETIISYHVGNNFFTVNLQEIRQAVKTLTWVKDVQVQRVWPDTLSLTIQEHIIFARWNNEKAIDETGRLLNVPVKTLSSALPIFMSTKNTIQKVLARYNVLNPQIESLGLHIQQVVYNTQQTWTIVLDNGMKLLLGRDNNNQGLQHFITMYKQLQTSPSLRTILKKKNIAHIDLRYTHGMVVQLKSEN